VLKYFAKKKSPVITPAIYSWQYFVYSTRAKYSLNTVPKLALLRTGCWDHWPIGKGRQLLHKVQDQLWRSFGVTETHRRAAVTKGLGWKPAASNVRSTRPAIERNLGSKL
jgi:hypothetical protein